VTTILNLIQIGIIGSEGVLDKMDIFWIFFVCEKEFQLKRKKFEKMEKLE